MRYYKVIEQFDGAQVLKTGRKGLYIDRELIGNELYTAGEIRTLLNGATIRGKGINNNTRVFEAVDIKRNATYTFFGARFA